METIARLNYSSGPIEDPEDGLGHIVKRTIETNTFASSILSFRIPPDAERFSDLSNVLLAVDIHVERADGTKLGKDDKPFMAMMGMHSLFKSCDVRFDGRVVSTMGAYPYTAAIMRILGSTLDHRLMLKALDGTEDMGLARSSLDFGKDQPKEDGRFRYLQKRLEGSKSMRLCGRIYSDVLGSSRQYLPPNVELGIDLRRAPDSFSVNCTLDTVQYRVVIDSASLYVKRLAIKPSLIARPLATLKNDASMVFNRLDTRIRTLPEGQKMWNWLDCLNGGPLPNRIYVGFVRQAAFYGGLQTLSTYFENLNLSSFNAKFNGRDLMVEPCVASYKKKNGGKTDFDGSDALMPYLALLELTDTLRDTLSGTRFQYTDYINGYSLLALELSKSGEKSGTRGTLDLEVCLLACFCYLPSSCILCFSLPLAVEGRTWTLAACSSPNALKHWSSATPMTKQPPVFYDTHWAAPVILLDLVEINGDGNWLTHARYKSRKHWGAG